MQRYRTRRHVSKVGTRNVLSDFGQRGRRGIWRCVQCAPGGVPSGVPNVTIIGNNYTGRCPSMAAPATAAARRGWLERSTAHDEEVTFHDGVATPLADMMDRAVQHMSTTFPSMGFYGCTVELGIAWVDQSYAGLQGAGLVLVCWIVAGSMQRRNESMALGHERTHQICCGLRAAMQLPESITPIQSRLSASLRACIHASDHLLMSELPIEAWPGGGDNWLRLTSLASFSLWDYPEDVHSPSTSEDDEA